MSGSHAYLMTDYKSPGGDWSPAARAIKQRKLALLRERAARHEALFEEAETQKTPKRTKGKKHG